MGGSSDVEDDAPANLDENLFEAEDEENESDENNNAVPEQVHGQFIARDQTVWTESPLAARKIMAHNILKSFQPGPTKLTKNLQHKELFKLIISDSITTIIRRETNRKGQQFCDEWNAEHSDNRREFLYFSDNELIAFLGLVFFAGAIRSNREHIRDMWNQKSHPIFRAAMGRNRFVLLCQLIRFDNGNTRTARLLKDKAAGIRDTFDMFSHNLKRYYVAGENVTVDEQLFPFRGRLGFKQYIPSKPAKYEIKVWWVNDSKSTYPIHGQIYTGMALNGERETNQGQRVVKDLCCRLFSGSGRNITCDNFFTTYDLATQLMNEHRLSVLGTVNKRRRFIPKEFLADNHRELFSSKFAYSNNITLCSYVPKKKKAVIVLSTSHYSPEVNVDKQKPVMITDYNKTKGGVDTMDRMLTEYTCKRRTNRWTLAFFYNILDVSVLACYIIYKENHPRQNLERRTFIKDLALSLVEKAIDERSSNPQITRHFSTRGAIESIVGKPLNVPYTRINNQNPSAPKSKNKQGKCKDCLNKKIQKVSRSCCNLCNKNVCASHQTKLVVGLVILWITLTLILNKYLLPLNPVIIGPEQ